MEDSIQKWVGVEDWTGLGRAGRERRGAGEGRPRRPTSPSSHLVTPGDDHVGCYLWWVGWVGDVLAGKVA